MSNATDIAKIILDNDRANQQLARAVENGVNVQINHIVLQQVTVNFPKESGNRSLIKKIVSIILSWFGY
jgi:hypothetical protein